LKGNAGEYYANGTGNSSSSLSSCRDKDVGCSDISGIMYDQQKNNFFFLIFFV
jgi:hypothetical protein